MSRAYLYRRLKHEKFRRSLDFVSPAADISDQVERELMAHYLARALDAQGRDNEAFLQNALLDRSKPPRVRKAG